MHSCVRWYACVSMWSVGCMCFIVQVVPPCVRCSVFDVSDGFHVRWSPSYLHSSIFEVYWSPRSVCLSVCMFVYLSVRDVQATSLDRSS